MYSSDIILVYPEPMKKKHKRFGFSLNIAYISAILKKNGLNTIIYDFSNDDLAYNNLISNLNKSPRSIIAVEFDSFALARDENYENGINLIAELKKLFPECYLVSFGYDCVILQEDIQGSDTTIKNDIIKEVCRKIFTLAQKNESSELIYDELPFPDRDGFQQIDFFNRNHYSTLIQTSTGCNNTCAFCQRKGWQHERYEHSLDYIKSEFELLCNQGYKNIWVSDENFTFNLSRAKKILRMLIDTQLTRNMKLAISSWSKIDYDFIELAQKANVKIISMGIESANLEVLSFYKKSIDLNHVRDIILYADSLGIYMVGNFIIGAPMETKQMIENTFNYIDSLKLDQVNIKVLDYMIGSDLYSNLPAGMKHKHHYFCCKENGLGLIEIDELIKMKKEFISNYISNNSNRLKEKIEKFGTPYFVMRK